MKDKYQPKQQKKNSNMQMGSCNCPEYKHLYKKRTKVEYGLASVLPGIKTVSASPCRVPTSEQRRDGAFVPGDALTSEKMTGKRLIF